MEKVRPIFLYLAVVAVLLGIFGVFLLVGKPTGKVVVEEDVNKYSLEDISLHSLETDCWLIEDNSVYDVSLFLRTYKDDRLIGECGKDIGSFGFLPENVRVELRGNKIGVVLSE